MTPTREQIRRAYIDACHDEIEALKPGNVHRFADGHGMSAAQFFDSAQISAGAVSDAAQPTGKGILSAVDATRQKVGTNTNLGIVLLCVPLARAAALEGRDLRQGLMRTLDKLDDNDARDVFAAIVLAKPGGLGTASEHDVAEPPVVPLLEAMRSAADRDMIARQYANGFADIFEGGLAAHADAVLNGEDAMWPAVFVYLHFLSSFPDSHVIRKHGIAAAESIMLEAREIQARILQIGDGREREKLLLAFDTRLKGQGFNPGTSADLTVASLFASKLIKLLHNDDVSA
ncbi:triphosphoribosyl-dephospho-CoA synthase [Phyllobacterium sp. 21LDTY02-6]|uniref:triphosphoribosyl-dephospho-CoA synthase n=1 Tax=Phyllobacterium sp. 21LDTY02-6 TaxID=2944903 RepID=UPI00201FD27C|nr:triphosphoribosyl-dephospho-CoA synthase [Phyllobacterium sp. 21LDTY02-6]